MVDCTLRQMRLTGFRSICSQEVAFDNPTFVVGPNGSGKSNFADAFAVLAEAMVSPLQAVIERRGGFAAVSHRSSARGRTSNLTLRVTLEKPDSDTTDARYYVDLRPRKGNDFEVAEEMCVVSRSDGSQDKFRRRTVKGSTKWDISVKSLDPAVEPNALALPLVAGPPRGQGRRGTGIRIRSVLAAPRSNWRRGCSPALPTSKRRTNRRSAHRSRCRPPTVGHGRFAGSPTRLGTWSTPWGTMSACGRRLPGPRSIEGISPPAVTVGRRERRKRATGPGTRFPRGKMVSASGSTLGSGLFDDPSLRNFSQS